MCCLPRYSRSLSLNFDNNFDLWFWWPIHISTVPFIYKELLERLCVGSLGIFEFQNKNTNMSISVITLITCIDSIFRYPLDRNYIHQYIAYKFEIQNKCRLNPFPYKVAISSFNVHYIPYELLVKNNSPIIRLNHNFHISIGLQNLKY